MEEYMLESSSTTDLFSRVPRTEFGNMLGLTITTQLSPPEERCWSSGSFGQMRPPRLDTPVMWGSEPSRDVDMCEKQGVDVVNTQKRRRNGKQSTQYCPVCSTPYCQEEDIAQCECCGNNLACATPVDVPRAPGKKPKPGPVGSSIPRDEPMDIDNTDSDWFSNERQHRMYWHTHQAVSLQAMIALTSRVLDTEPFVTLSSLGYPPLIEPMHSCLALSRHDAESKLHYHNSVLASEYSRFMGVRKYNVDLFQKQRLAQVKKIVKRELQQWIRYA